MEKDLEKENLFGTMERNLKDNGKIIKNRALEFGNPRREIIMKEIGQIIGNLEKGFLNTREGQIMKVASKIF